MAGCKLVSSASLEASQTFPNSNIYAAENWSGIALLEADSIRIVWVGLYAVMDSDTVIHVI